MFACRASLERGRKLETLTNLIKARLQEGSCLTVYISGASPRTTVETEPVLRARRAALAAQAKRPLDVVLACFWLAKTFLNKNLNGPGNQFAANHWI
jgi:hypothetical protein